MTHQLFSHGDDGGILNCKTIKHENKNYFNAFILQYMFFVYCTAKEQVGYKLN